MNTQRISSSGYEQTPITAPLSVHKSVYEQADDAGKAGTDAADQPLAARKSADAAGETEENLVDADLTPEEGADVMETREEAQKIKQARDERDDEFVHLDGSD